MPETVVPIGPDVKNAKQGEGGGGPRSLNKPKGKEWSSDTQNELAQNIEKKAAEQLKGLKDVLPVRPVQDGDTLGALARGLLKDGKKNFSWGLEVDYRSGRIPEGKKPKTLNKADKIWSGQFVWIEEKDGKKIVVVDDNPPVILKKWEGVNPEKGDEPKIAPANPDAKTKLPDLKKWEGVNPEKGDEPKIAPANPDARQSPEVTPAQPSAAPTEHYQLTLEGKRLFLLSIGINEHNLTLFKTPKQDWADLAKSDNNFWQKSVLAFKFGLFTIDKARAWIQSEQGQAFLDSDAKNLEEWLISLQKEKAKTKPDQVKVAPAQSEGAEQTPEKLIKEYEQLRKERDNLAKKFNLDSPEDLALISENPETAKKFLKDTWLESKSQKVDQDIVNSIKAEVQVLRKALKKKAESVEQIKTISIANQQLLKQIIQQVGKLKELSIGVSPEIFKRAKDVIQRNKKPSDNLKELQEINQDMKGVIDELEKLLKEKQKGQVGTDTSQA